MPGKFTTLRGWTDPFVLLAREDPDGQQIASVLSQEGDRDPIIEGVSGIGSDFMLGRQSPEQLPTSATTAVRELINRVIRLVGGTIKLEWAFDGELVWILQMQQLDHAVQDSVIVAGDADEFRHFDASEGIDRFRDFVEAAKKANVGVILDGAVGITSHFGDIL